MSEKAPPTRMERGIPARIAGAVRRTGAVDLGIVARKDISGFNYAKMPSLLVECGFMSNADEDRRSANPSYQDKIAAGISSGVLAFLNRD